MAETGAFTLTGIDADLIATILKHYKMTAEAGAFALTGQDAGLLIGRVLTAETGAFALAGNDVVFLRALRLVAESGQFELAGVDVSLILGVFRAYPTKHLIRTSGAAVIHSGGGGVIRRPKTAIIQERGRE